MSRQIDSYITIFDITQNTFNWIAPALGLVVFIGCLIIGVFNLPSYSLRGKRLSKTYTRTIAFVGAGFSLLWAVFVFIGAWTVHQEFQEAMQQNNYKLVEGVIEDFTPMTNARGAYEQFRVRGVLFRYSDFIETGAFNTTTLKGGPIKENLAVRIYYIPSSQGNLILRLDIAQN